MIYLKTEQFEGKEIRVEIYENEFYTMCPKCSKECKVEFEELIKMLNEGIDFSSTSHYCSECSKKILNEQRRKEKSQLKLIK